MEGLIQDQSANVWNPIPDPIPETILHQQVLDTSDTWLRYNNVLLEYKCPLVSLSSIVNEIPAAND